MTLDDEAEGTNSTTSEDNIYAPASSPTLMAVPVADGWLNHYRYVFREDIRGLTSDPIIREIELLHSTMGQV